MGTEFEHCKALFQGSEVFCSDPLGQIINDQLNQLY